MVATYVTAFDEFCKKQLEFIECEGKLNAQIKFQNVGKFQILIVILKRKRVNQKNLGQIFCEFGMFLIDLKFKQLYLFLFGIWNYKKKQISSFQT